MIDQAIAMSSVRRGQPRAGDPRRPARRIAVWAVLMLGVGGVIAPALAEPLACDDGLKTAFHPDADTAVVAVRQVKKGEELLAPDSP